MAKMKLFYVSDPEGGQMVEALDATSAFEQVFDVSPSEVVTSDDLYRDLPFTTPVVSLVEMKRRVKLLFVSADGTQPLMVEVVEQEDQADTDTITSSSQYEKNKAWIEHSKKLREAGKIDYQSLHKVLGKWNREQLEEIAERTKSDGLPHPEGSGCGMCSEIRYGR